MMAVATSLAGSRWSTMCAQSRGLDASSVVSGWVSVSVSVITTGWRAGCMPRLCLARSAVDDPAVVTGRQRALGVELPGKHGTAPLLLRRPVVGDEHGAPGQDGAGHDERHREPQRHPVRGGGGDD